MEEYPDAYPASVATAEVLEHLIKVAGDRMPARIRADFEKLIRRAKAEFYGPKLELISPRRRADTEG